MNSSACQVNGNFQSKEYTVIATGKNGVPLIVAYQAENGGRMIIDCFRERLFNDAQLVNSQRFLKNGAAWLTFSKKFNAGSRLQSLWSIDELDFLN